MEGKDPEKQHIVEDSEVRLHVFIRKDLQMSKGKICSQTAHAVLGLYKDL